MIDERSVKRFRRKVDVRGEDECWNWTAAINSNGYGSFRVRRPNGTQTVINAHRFAAALAGMPIDGTLICHRCDNPRCCNPRHLFVGTHRDNAQDMVNKGRWNPVSGQHGKGSKNIGLWKRIPDADIPHIRSRVSSGETQAIIAREYGVSHAAINHIVNGRRRVVQ